MKTRTKVLLSVAAILVVALATVGALMVFNKSPNLLDSEFSVIVTGSMDGEPQSEYEIETIPVNSLIAVHKLHGDDYKDVKKGDVIGFYSARLNANIYHRVIDIKDGYFITHGDAAKTGADEIVYFEDANGIVVNVNHPAGEFVSFVKKNIFLLVAIVVLILILSEAVIYFMKTWKE